MTLLVACPSSTALTRWANVREQTVSATFFSTGAAWTTISVLESPPRITINVHLDPLLDSEVESVNGYDSQL